MNTKIFDYLNIYASTPNPQYAIMLRGKWGCGKTHFIKGWLNKFEVKDFADDADLLIALPDNRTKRSEDRRELSDRYRH